MLFGRSQLCIRAGGLPRGFVAWECGSCCGTGHFFGHCDLTLTLKTDKKILLRLAIKALFVLDFVLMVLNLLAYHRNSGKEA